MSFKKFCSCLNNREHRKFLKMRRRHRKELKALAKNSEDFDFGYLHELVDMKLRHFLEYYESGCNVWQTDETRNEIITSLKEGVELADRIKNDHDWRSEYIMYKDFYEHIAEHILKWWD